MILYIYDVKTLNIVAKPIVNSNSEFTNNPLNFYPEWNTEIHLVSEIEFQNPILDIDNQIREKTREELILLDNKIDLLQDGEYIDRNKIIVAEPSGVELKKKWNKETNEWEEGATLEDINKEVDILIKEFINLSEQKEKYHKYGFETFEIENKIAENIIRRKFLLEIF